MRYNFVIFFLLFSFLVKAQESIDVRFEQPFYKEALICDVLIHTVGEKQVISWMKTGKGTLFVCEVDTLGKVLSIKERKASLGLSSNQLNKMKAYMSQNEIRIPFFVGEEACIQNDKRSFVRKKIELRQTAKYGQPIYIYVVFNDEIIRGYPRLQKQHKEYTLSNHLQSQISRYYKTVK